VNPDQCRQRVDGVWVCGECGFAYDLVPDAVSDRLSDGPSRVRQTMASVEPVRMDRPPRPGVWSPRQYLAHLTDWAEIILERLRRILHEDGPILPGRDQDLLAVEHDYATWDVSEALDRFEAATAAARQLIQTEGAGAWHRLGVRDDFGELEFSLIANDLVHELDHHLLDIQGIHVGR